jgi:hypothetical protein
VDLFRTIMAGERTDQQAKQFGDRQTRLGRKVIVQTIGDYAQTSGNYLLSNLLRRLEGEPSQATATSRKPEKVVRLKPSDQERDYSSIVSVMDRFQGRPVGSAEFGKFRRRWLEMAPRNADSGHRNRLEEVLGQMVQDGVLKAIRTSRGAVVYTPGAAYETYREKAGIR